MAVAAPAQFSVWLVKGGIWTQVGLFDANGGASYARQVAATVPVGTGYHLYVYYRASSGAPWSVDGLAAGTVDVTASSTFESIDVTAPATPTGVVRGADLAVGWAPNVAVAAPAQFSVWLVKGGIWTQVGLFDANGGASYARQVAANVPVGTGYSLYVYYRASSGAPWSVYGLAPGTVDVAAGFTAIALDDFADHRVIQRDVGGTSKSVTISGTSSNMDWSRIEARVLRHGSDTVAVDWTTIDPTPGGGTFSGGLVVPQGGWYYTEVRALDSSGSVLGASRGTNRWGVGMIILVIGQSNMSGRGQPPYTIASSDLAVNFSNAGVWEHLADPYDDESPAGAVDNDNDAISGSNSGGSMIPSIANTLLQTFDFPIAFVPAAKGGSNLYVNAGNYGWAYRNPASHFDTSTLYGQSITKAQSVGGVELIIMHQGEADLSDGRTEAQYQADFATMIGHYRQDLHAGIPIFICQLGTVGAGTNAGATGIRTAQHKVDNGTDAFMGATAMDLPRIDTWHYNTSALTVIGSRLANAIKYYLGRSTYYRGPSINSASFSDGSRNQVVVALDHRGGTDITPGSGITGFEVFDNGSGVALQSAARAAPDAVRLTLSRSISSGHTVTLRYLYGTTPNVSGLVKDDSPLALPLEGTTGSVTVTDAAAADFSVIILPDTQFYAQNPGGNLAAIFNAQTQWIVNNRVPRNIAFVGHMGDITQNGENGGNPVEWNNANAALSLLEDPATTGLPQGMPFGVLPGNHDFLPGGQDAAAVFYNQYFGVSRFTGRDYYGGNYGSNNNNSYQLFSAGGMDFIVINLAYRSVADPAILAWADGLLETYPDRRAIVNSHWIIGTGDPASFGGQGQAIYDRLKDNANFFLMNSGHVHGEGKRSDTYQGRTVHTILTDYQSAANGGNGFLRILTFSPTNDTIHVESYSPTLGRAVNSSDGVTAWTGAYDLPYTMPGDAMTTPTARLEGASERADLTRASPIDPAALFGTSVTSSTGSGVTSGQVAVVTKSVVEAARGR